MRWLTHLFPPFEEPAFVKPRDMLYIAAEIPARSVILVLGLQHALIVLTQMVYSVLVGREIGLAGESLQGFVALNILLLGVAGLMQTAPTRLGSGHLILHTPSIVGMVAFLSVVQSAGLGVAAGGLVMAGVLVLLFARILPKLEGFFPSEVNGVLLFLLGLSLGRPKPTNPHPRIMNQ